jgi:SAM-dependent MidA family methyltransferase
MAAEQESSTRAHGDLPADLARLLAAGPLPFAALMEEALYGPEGYYRRPELPIGEGGDFVTGSSLSPLFGRATARLLRRLDGALGRPADFLEAGPGTGAHLAALVPEVGITGRRLLAWDRVARPLPAGVEALADLADLAPGGLEGLIFSYELFDALPVHRLIGREDGSLGELWVELSSGGSLAWREGELSDPALAGLLADPDVPLQPGQIADLAPGWRPLYRALAERLGRGLLVTCDYGFERPLLLDPRVRRHGTLACYRGQRVHRDPFVQVGRQDLTAHVDFTVLRREGEAAGLATVALTRQAFWLAACGIFDELPGAGIDLRRQAMALLDGEGMGEETRVLVQARGLDPGSVLDMHLVSRGSR